MGNEIGEKKEETLATARGASESDEAGAARRLPHADAPPRFYESRDRRDVDWRDEVVRAAHRPAEIGEAIMQTVAVGCEHPAQHLLEAPGICRERDEMQADAALTARITCLAPTPRRVSTPT